MARNANYDKARLQAVGVYRKASPHAAINNGVAVYSGGDYRAPEGAKACYSGKLQVPEYDRAMVRRLPPAKHVGDYRKRTGSCPQERATLTASGCRSSSPAMKKVLTLDVYVAHSSRLIARAR
jgi:hypothetical protein